MISGILVKFLSIALLIGVGIVLILGIGTLFKGGRSSKKIFKQVDAIESFTTICSNYIVGKFCLFFKN